MKVNLHTHTYRCRHAKGTDEEYVLAAIDAGYDKLGFADHTPFPYENGFFNDDKMLVEELPDYIDSVLTLKEKYRGQIEILLGLECEAVPEFFPFLKEMKQKMDYLILGSHGDTIGVLPAEVLRRRTAGKTLLGKMCFRQSGTVSDEKYRAVQLTEVFGEILQRDGPVFT
jgi:histidinol phosphatase-like PHP family hydrolase